MSDIPSLEIHPTARVSADARLHPSNRGTRIVVGEHCRINAHCTLYSGSGIRLGDYVLVLAGRVGARAVWGGNPYRFIRARGADS